MIASLQQSYLTADEYLDLEERGDIKHEYIDGQVYAMAGASDAHVTIAGNLFALLRSHVRGSGCRVYIADMKARIESNRSIASTTPMSRSLAIRVTWKHLITNDFRV